jgi:hypothetical protein
MQRADLSYRVVEGRREDAIKSVTEAIHRAMMDDHGFMLEIVENGFIGVSNYTDEQLSQEADELDIADQLVVAGILEGGEDKAFG